MSNTGVRHLLGVIAGLGAVFFYASFSSSSEVFIVVNPGPFRSIEQAAVAEESVNWWDADLTDDNACTESFAAAELKRYLPECTTLNEADMVLMSSADSLPESGSVLIIGSRQSNPHIDKIGEERTKAAPIEEPESFRIHAFHENDRSVCIIEGSDRIGCLYGVYEYLERLGMRFFGLREQGTVYPDAPAGLIDNLNIQESPAYRSRGFHAWEDRGDETFLMWMARNRLNYWSAAQSNPHFCKKIGLNLVLGGHEPTKLFLDPDAEYPYDHPFFKGDEEKPEDPYSPPPKEEYRGDTNADGKLTLFEAHPEWYGLLDGKRQSEIIINFGKCNFCTSNQDAVHFLAENLIQSLVDGDYKYADIVNLWALDNEPWCTCRNCVALGTPTDRLLLFVHQVHQIMKQAREEGRLPRPIFLHTCAYHETLPPPTRPLPEDFDYGEIAVTIFPIGRSYTHSLGDPASTEVNRHHTEQFLGWAHGEYYHGSICIGEYYNVSRIRTLPVVYSKTMAADIPWYYLHGARDFQYMHTPTQMWGTWTLNQWLMAQLLWNPESDSDELLKDYFARYYPTASEPARTFYEHLERATSNIKAIKHYLESPKFERGYYSLRNQLEALKPDLFPYKVLKYEEYHPVTDDGIDWVQVLDEMHLARKAIDSALLQCENGVEMNRLLEDEKRFAYGEATFEFYNRMIRCLMAHHQGQANEAALEFEKADRVADELRAMVDVVQGAGEHGSDVNAFEAAMLPRSYGILKEQYGGKRNQPFRGAWVHIDQLFGEEDDIETREASIAKALNDCKRSGLKAIIPFTLTSRGRSHYPSDIVPESEFGDWDALGVVVREARLRNLEVYLAVPVLVCGHDEPKGILKRHPEWAVIGKDGQPLGYISGGNPEARKWILSLIEELLRKYQPEGIMLDYLRFPNKPVDVDPTTRARFLLESGIDSYDIANRKNEKWQSFKEQCLIELCGQIRDTVEKTKPGTSIAIYTWGPYVVNNYYVAQDWVTMAKKGYLDQIHVSGYIYRDNYGENYFERFEQIMKEAVSLLPEGSSDAEFAFVLGVITSHGRIETVEQLEKYLRLAHKAGVEGVSVFTLTYLQPFIDDILKNAPLDVPRE